MWSERGPRLGDLSEPVDCPWCDGEGFQLEIVWVGGVEQSEHEVPCFACAGRGHVVELVCGRCGQTEHAHPDDAVTDVRICAECGHEAPNYLWLPMGWAGLTTNDKKETG